LNDPRQPAGRGDLVCEIPNNCSCAAFDSKVDNWKEVEERMNSAADSRLSPTLEEIMDAPLDWTSLTRRCRPQLELRPEWDSKE